MSLYFPDARGDAEAPAELVEVGERARLCLVLENADPNVALLEIEDRCEVAWLARHGIEAPDER